MTKFRAIGALFEHETTLVDTCNCCLPQGFPTVLVGKAIEARCGVLKPRDLSGTRVTRLSIRELLTFDAAIGADFLGPTPALIVHGRRDEYCSPDAAQDIYRLTGPKELLWLDTTNHIDLYDQPAFVDPAVHRIRRWLNEHL